MDKYTNVIVPIKIYKFDDEHLHHHFTNREKFSVTDQCDREDWIFNYKYEVYALNVRKTIVIPKGAPWYEDHGGEFDYDEFVGYTKQDIILKHAHKTYADISSLFTPQYNRETNTVEIKAKNTEQLNFWLKHYDLLFQIHFDVPTETILNRNKA